MRAGAGRREAPGISQGVDRYLRLDLRRLARAVLSEGRAEKAVARLVRDPVSDQRSAAPKDALRLIEMVGGAALVAG
jgi:hypothetical protein